MLEPTTKRAPIRDGVSEAVAMGAIHENAVPIFIFESVLDEILDYSAEDHARELGGFLVGGVHQDQRLLSSQQNYVEIRHYLPAVDARSRAASLTFTHDTWAQMNREVDEKHPEETVLGWHHTHPGFGVFLSGYDMFIHRNFFREPWQIAMVVDPIRQELEFFQWREDEVVDCGFVCVMDNSRQVG